MTGMPPKINVNIPDIFYPFIHRNVRHKVAHGGRGSSKSHSMARLLLLRGAENQERILCVREYQASIKDSVKQLLDDLIEDMNLGYFYKTTNNEIKGINGTSIKFGGLRKDPHSIKSMEGITICWIEEANVVSQSSLDLLIPTIREENSEIWMTLNREFKTDPVDKKFVQSKRDDVMVIEVNYDDNPWFPEVLRKEMEYDKAHDAGRYEHIWRGKPIVHSEALVFSNKYRIEEISPPEGTPLYFGADWGFSSDPFAMLRTWLDEDKREIYIDYEAYGVGIEYEDLPAQFDTLPRCKEYQISADNARPDTISYMRRKGYPIHGCKKGPGSVKDGTEFLRSYTIVVHPRCKNMLNELALYSYKVDKRTGMVLPELEDKNNHLIDSLRYALEKLMGLGGEIFVG